MLCGGVFYCIFHHPLLTIMAQSNKRVLAVVFNNMTFMDFNGPHTAMSMTGQYKVETVAIKGNETSIVTKEGLHLVADYHFENVPTTKYDILLIPGGLGTRTYANDSEFIAQVKQLCAQSEMIFTICTGAALLAKTGLLDGKEATSNKRAWEWVIQQGPKVNWIKERRWVDVGSILTSSGVSAGIDAGLYLIARQFGDAIATESATQMEYNWVRNPFEWQLK